MDDISKKYNCDVCRFYSDRSPDYKRHMNTTKHKNNIARVNRNNNYSANKKPSGVHHLVCACGKKYKSTSGLWKHHQTCVVIQGITSDESDYNIDNIDFSRTEWMDRFTTFIKGRLDLLLRIAKEKDDAAQLAMNQMNSGVFQGRGVPRHKKRVRDESIENKPKFNIRELAGKMDVTYQDISTNQFLRDIGCDQCKIDDLFGEEFGITSDKKKE